MRALFGRLLGALTRWWGRWFDIEPSLPAGAAVPGSRSFLQGLYAMSASQLDGWLRVLRAELPFPQPRFGAAEAPPSAEDFLERLGSAGEEVRQALGRAPPGEPTGDPEPEWFLCLADRLLPLACWGSGLGLPDDGGAAPDLLRELKGLRKDFEKNLKGLVRALPATGARSAPAAPEPAPPRTQGTGLQAAYLGLLKVHLEALLVPLGATVTLEVPALGARVAELVPPPAPGSPTSGVVGRVLCPSVSVRLPGGLVLSRGAHVRNPA
ncbi:MAG: hypothetical protein HY909_31295 [Deltaproteobacteria bacterium]|nr:hypothetical protein [Deltaproteobacteria bacterium]